MPLKVIGKFSVSRLQVLDEEGKADSKLDPQLGEEDLLRLYRSMVLTREADQRMLKLQRQGRIGTFGPTTGQEAASCGAALAMGEKDWLVTAFREPGARLMRGDTLVNQFLMYNGYEEGNVLPPEKRMTPTAIIVGSQLLHAVGIAYAMKYRRQRDSAVVTFCGEGATSQGDFHEALNFAGVWQAPVVFVVQNNQWAISMPRSRQTRSQTLAQKAIAYGLPGLQVDGNDALAMFRATREALERARAGEGPTLIEADTYRLMMHTTADDARKYRGEEEEAAAWKREPLIRLRLYLEGKGLWDAARQEALEKELRGEIEAAVKEFESRTSFKPDAPFDHVLGTPSEEIERQRREFLENLEKEGGHA